MIRTAVVAKELSYNRKEIVNCAVPIRMDEPRMPQCFGRMLTINVRMATAARVKKKFQWTPYSPTWTYRANKHKLNWGETYKLNHFRGLRRITSEDDRGMQKGKSVGDLILLYLVIHTWCRDKSSKPQNNQWTSRTKTLTQCPRLAWTDKNKEYLINHNSSYKRYWNKKGCSNWHLKDNAAAIEY